MTQKLARIFETTIRGGRIDDGAAGEIDGAGIALFLALASAVDGDIDPMIAEDAQKLFNVGQMRHVFERQRVARQKGSDHQRQSGVFRSRDRNGALEFVAAQNSDAIHKL